MDQRRHPEARSYGTLPATDRGGRRPSNQIPRQDRTVMVTLLNTRDPLALFRKMYAEHVTAPIAASHTNIRQQHLKADLATINAQCATFAGHPAIPRHF